MKTTKKFTKPLAIIAVMASLALTGCAGDKLTPENAPTPTVAGQSQSATESPSAAPSLTAAPSQSAFEIDPEVNPTAIETVKDDEINRLMREGLNTALDIDVEEAYKYATDEVEESFGEERAKEGAAFAMEFLHDITTTANFYEKRDGSKDFELINTDDFVSRMDAGLLDAIQKDIADTGYFKYIPALPSDGIVKTGGGEELSMTRVPVTTYKTPGLEAVDMGEAGTGLMVDGARTDHHSLTKGYTASQPVNYWVVVVPSGDSWKVLNFGWTSENTDLVKAGEAK